jgi:hypothetical protein
MLEITAMEEREKILSGEGREKSVRFQGVVGALG